MAASIHSATSSSFISYVQKSDLPPEEVRSKLIEMGIIPSPHEAKENFFALGDQWWMFIIDGKYHRHGPEVFDLGLHGGDKEPGYLKGIRMGCDHFVHSFDSDLSVDLYAEIHLRACKHFEGKPGDGTLCSGEMIHQYRVDSERCCSNFLNQNLLELHEKQKFYRSIQDAKDSLPGTEDSSEWDEFDVAHVEKVMKTYFPESTEPMTIAEMTKMLREQVILALCRLDAANREYFDKMYKELSAFAARYSFASEIAGCSVSCDGRVVINYFRANEPYFYRDATQKIIHRFNAELQALQGRTYLQIQTEGIGRIEEIKAGYRESALVLIAKLYAELEWTHPWIDGQGRTDLILLNGLLTREGMHPCILKEPYYSTFHTIEEWVVYLKTGLAAYEELMRVYRK